MRHWLAASIGELAAFAAEAGQPAFRAKQLHDWLHAQRADRFAAMSNLPAAFREALAAEGRLRVLRERERRDTADGLTSKWLWEAEDGGLVESVLIVEKRRSRRTVCVSSMIGCPLACAFCATGAGGFERNLSAGEIIEQVYAVDARARGAERSGGVSHVVFMGMGEPLLNLDNALQAANAFRDPGGMGLSGRHVTFSTAGVPDGIRALAASGVNCRLAVSLHASSQETRQRLMPCAKTWPLPELFAALEVFAAASSRDITFEYCLVDGVNASRADARELVRLIAPFRCKINLIPMNPVPGAPFAAPSPSAVRAFQETLESAGLCAPLRTEKGASIGAACGQLRARGEKSRP